MPPQGEGKIRHLPVFIAGLGGGSQLPPIAKRSLKEELSCTNPAIAGGKGPIRCAAFFSGCATTFVPPAAGKALVNMLNQSGGCGFSERPGLLAAWVLGHGKARSDKGKDVAIYLDSLKKKKFLSVSSGIELSNWF